MNFRVVHVFLFNPRGDLLLHQLASSKRHAGAWGSSVAGGVRAGETPFAAARRELREELGVKRARLHQFGKARVSDEGVTKFLTLFAAVAQEAGLRPDPQEIAAVEFVPVGRVRERVRTREKTFTPTFLMAFRLMERAVVA